MFATNSFEFEKNKEICEKDYLKDYPDTKLKPKKIRFSIGERIHIKCPVGCHTDPLDSAHYPGYNGTVIDIAKFGGNGGFFKPKNANMYMRDQEPIYRIKIEKLHDFYMKGIITDDVCAYNDELQKIK
jgi:hypothetical protein